MAPAKETLLLATHFVPRPRPFDNFFTHTSAIQLVPPNRTPPMRAIDLSLISETRIITTNKTEKEKGEDGFFSIHSPLDG